MATRRREAGEDLYRQKFIDFGLTDKFEFIKREWSLKRDKRFWSRCKTCGCEFISWNEVFKGRQSHLLCPQCGASSDGNDIWERSPRCDQAMAFYAAGHSVKETAEKFGASECQINNSVKKRGLTNGRDWNESGKEAARQQSREAEQRIVERLESFGLLYVGGYSNKDNKIAIKCKTCGDVFYRTANHVKKGNLICRKCEHEKTLIRKAKQRAVRKADAERKRAKQEAERLLHHSKDYYTDLHNVFLNRAGICEICGKPYTVKEYVESCGMKYARDNGVCSDKCRRIKANRQCRESRKRRGVQDNHRHRAKKNGCHYDPSITLAKLIKRDGLRCAICGEMCDPNDRSWTKYSGPMYPSIDHIVPISKGGDHTWDNIQVAHIICNSLKGDQYDAS